LGTLEVLINEIFFHYTGDLYIPSIFLWISPIILALTCLAFYAEQHTPRLAYFTKTYGIYFFIVLVMDWLTTGTQFTPFPPIDHALVLADQALGFNSIAVLNWTYAHPHILSLMNQSYSSLGYEMFFLPLIMAISMEKAAVHRYFLAAIISFLIATSIYYFFPTTALTGVLHSPHFLPSQHATYLKFFQVHHRLPVSTYDGGLIAFPSCHVVWAILLIVLCQNKKWLFYPILCFNAIIILSTVMLGWHYMLDVLGAGVVVMLSIWLGAILDKRISIKLTSYKTTSWKAESKYRAC
jgi:membrane-associated phospholipid phosphatase